MGFFSELKNDLSQAVNTLMPEDTDKPDIPDNSDRGNKPEKVDIDSMLNRLDDIKLDEAVPEAEEEIVEEEKKPVEEPKSAMEVIAELKHQAAEKGEEAAETVEETVKEKLDEIVEEVEDAEEEVDELEEKIEETTREEVKNEPVKSAIEAVSASHVEEYVAEKETVAEEYTNNNGGYETMDFEQQTPTDETASITEGMVISGDIQTTGSLDLIGKVTGNIKCLGKLNVTGEIVGDSDAAEIYAESARVTGEVRSKGSVKVGQSTVIVGNIFGSSAVIAGAVKGDIDVHGPVVLDTTAIVMGDIKSQSVQINNGAVIEGRCSQAYADVNPSEFFETLKNR